MNKIFKASAKNEVNQQHMMTLLKDADYVFLGTKPHDFDALATRIKPHITKDNCFISIMAYFD